MTAEHPPRSITSILNRLLDRRDRWGHLTTTVTRYGSASSTLVVYPPGTPADERRRQHLAESWSTIGFVLLLAFAALALTGADAWWIASILTLLYGAGGLALARTTARTRRASAHASAHASLLADATLGDDIDHLASLAAVLRRADADLDEGELTPVEHELVWTAVHRAVAAHESGRQRGGLRILRDDPR
ncbi:hypothetical protein SAMN06295885_2574 [Rathayibacter oskolensis]|uniref:Uncharacterized protein n=1 Tax=Rathayibacter oskolensis TaxID=1891671 RepID=A0A1X7P5W1_9MICO|nr:DUF6611 family protein [Rathayibacter oskolensis]SMH45610.1 hypothetical protein SAMN06295885_2574 [Rathayibacter oskolensis]